MTKHCLLNAFVATMLLVGCQSTDSRKSTKCEHCGLGKANGSYRIGPSRGTSLAGIPTIIDEVETEQAELLGMNELSLSECHAMAVEHLCSPESDLECSAIAVQCEAPPVDLSPLTWADANRSVSLKGDISPYMHYHYRQMLCERVYQVEEAFWNLYRVQELCSLHPEEMPALVPAQRTLGKFLGLSARRSESLFVFDTPVEAPFRSDIWDEVCVSVNKRSEILEARDNVTLLNHFDDGENELVSERAVHTEHKSEEVKQKVAREVVESYHHVLNSEQQLREADSAETRIHALANYNIALAQLQWRRGTLLVRRKILYEDGYADGYVWNCSKEEPSCPSPYHPREGDVLLFTSGHPCYWNVAYRIGRTGQPYHSALVVRRSDGSLGLIQAGGDDDLMVTLYSVKYYLEEMSLWRSDPGVWIRRRKCPLTPRQSAALTTFAEERMGMSFTSTWRLLLFWLPGQPVPETQNDQESWFCSEIVGQALKYAGLLPQSVQAQLLAPRDLMFDKEVDLSRAWGPPRPWTAKRRFIGELPKGSPDYCPQPPSQLPPSICKVKHLMTR